MVLNKNQNVQIFVRVDQLATFFQKLYNQTIEGAQGKFENQIKMQGDELNRLKSKEIELLQERVQVVSNKNKVEARLNQTQFPFGKLPVSLDESVAAFPIALGIGFLVYVSLLYNVIRLRRELHIWYKRKDQGTNALDEQKISLLAPLWVDPIDTKIHQSLKFVILLIPFIIFIVSCYLTSYYIFLDQIIKLFLLLLLMNHLTMYRYMPDYIVYVLDFLCMVSGVLSMNYTIIKRRFKC
jgi:hypothetical protein